MSLKIRQLILLVISGILLIYAGCLDVPNKLVAPSWDVDLNIPIINREYTLQDVINKDSSMIKSYNDPSRIGLLYYNTTKDIDPVYVEDQLKMDPVTSDASVRLDSLRINTPTDVGANISVSDFTNLSPGDTGKVFPQIFGVPVSKNFQVITQFKSAIFERITIEVSFQNRLPVDASFIGFSIKNTNDNSVVIQDLIISLPAGQTVKRTYSFIEKTVNQSLRFETVISSPGSNGAKVNLSKDAGIGINFSIKNYTLYQVTGDLPPQPPFKFTGNFDIDDSTYFQTATVKSGKIILTVSNNLNVDLTFAITIHNMYDRSGGEFLLSSNLKKNEQNKVVEFSDLNGYTFKSTNNSLTRTLQYDITVQTSSSNGITTLKKFEYVQSKLQVNDMLVKDFSGRIKPTYVEVESRTLDLNLNNKKFNYSYDKLNLTDAKLKIRLYQSTGINFGYKGKILGDNLSQKDSVLIPYTIVGKTGTVIYIDSVKFRNFINGFTGKLPDAFTITGSAIANPDYQLGSVSSTDSIYGKAEVEVPFMLGVSNGSLKDTTNLDISNDIRNKRDQIGKLQITIELTNGLPAGGYFSAKVVDASGNFLMYLPPHRSPNPDSVSFPSANVDANGKVISSNSTKINIDLNANETDKFLSGKKVISLFSFGTSGTNAQPVQFKTTDAISVKAYGAVSYKVKN